MNQPPRITALFVLFIASIGILLFAAFGQLAYAQDSDILTPGAVVEAELTSRDGDEWALQLCAGDQVSVTMASADFSPYLEVYAPDDDEPLAEAEADDENAAIEALAIEESGDYLVVAAGERRQDRGDYTLAVTVTTAITRTGGAESDVELDLEPVDDFISSGQPVTGTIRARRSFAWGFRGCAGQIINLEMVSDEFDPYFELYANGEDDILVEGEFDENLPGVFIEDFELSRNGDYIILVAGESRRDAGDYTLTLALGDEDKTTPAPRRTSTPRATSKPRTTPTTDPALCTVKTNGLNLRYGPGTIYAPPIGSLALDAEVRMVARDATGNWIEVDVVDSDKTGWVSSASQYVACSSSIQSLPVGVIPPVPTPTNTATPLPTPTATPTQEIAQAPPRPPTEIGIGGGGGDGFDGEIRSAEGLAQGSKDNPTFRDQIYLRMFVRDPNEGRDDGDGIDYVEFYIKERDGGRQVHFRREDTAGYCSFGGGEPICNVLDIRPGAEWPDTGIDIQNDDYSAEIRVYPDGQNDYLSWNLNFTIFNPALGGGNGGDSQQGDIVARVAQTGPGNTNSAISGAIVFQVEAFDTGRGSGDGDGIRDVDMWIFGPDGDEVHQRTEGNAKYCIFSGGEPDCDIWNFGEHGNRWPNDKQLQPGPHLLRAQVNAEDGRTQTVEMRIDIQ